MRITVVGALGRMGANVISAAGRSGNDCVAYVDCAYGESRRENEYRRIADVREDTDVIIDFSFHAVTPEIAEYAAEKKIPVVIATTGHTESERANIIKAAEKTAVFYSGNMSIGIAALCETVKKVLSVFENADVEIIETHHNRKLDAPSGTALMLFDAVKEVRPDAWANCGRSGSGKREKNEVGIASVRSGNLVGIHEVRICTDCEQITLKHEAYDRALFADGAIKAAEYILGKEPGLYDMKALMSSSR